MAYNTVARIIQNAMENAGLLQEGQTPTSGQQALYMDRLNDVLNITQVEGLALRLMREVTVPLTAGQGLYTLGPTGSVVMVKPLAVVEADYMDASGIQRPLVALSWNEWTKLSQPAITGQVNSFFVDKQADSFRLNLWNVPDAQAALGTIKLLVRAQQTNVTSVTDTMAFSPEWFVYLHWALASEICVGQPESITQRCDAKRAYYLDKLAAWDTEDTSVQFQPDPQSGFNFGD